MYPVSITMSGVWVGVATAQDNIMVRHGCTITEKALRRKKAPTKIQYYSQRFVSSFLLHVTYHTCTIVSKVGISPHYWCACAPCPASPAPPCPLLHLKVTGAELRSDTPP